MSVSEVFFPPLTINRDVSAQPIRFRDAIRIKMKRTPVLPLIPFYPFYLGTHSSQITMGQRSGGTKPCSNSPFNETEKVILLNLSEAQTWREGTLRMYKSGP